MAVKEKKQTLGFQTEIKQLLDLMVHSLYSNKEVFLRELISNAADAVDKLRFEALQDDSLYEDQSDFTIRVEYNKEQKTITVLDNGIGMSHDEVVENLGTIARSGTKQFFESLTGEKGKDSQLIGQFGVGFYSAFIVADQVEVVSRRAGLARDKGVRWISSGVSEYTVEPFARPKRGTKIVLHLREGMDEFLDGQRLRGIITKYSDHISTPILMPKEGKDEKGDETVNSATALWVRNKKEIKKEEYNALYKHIAHDFEDPLAYLHSKVEGKLEYTSLLYIPAHTPFNFWDRDRAHGVRLYVRRVFVMDDAEQLLPAWLRFVKGVIDSNDLPLNISRELLQNNKTIALIRSGCIKKILGLLTTMARDDKERYIKFWEAFGKVIKEGVIDMAEHKDALTGLFRFASTHEDTQQQKVSLAEYIGRMQKEQKAIYYVTAENYVTAKHSPHLEIFNEKGIEVLLLTDPIDEWLTTHLSEYQGKPLSSVSKGELNLDDIVEQDKDSKTKSKQHEQEKEYTQLMQRIKKALDERVKDVRVTHRLTHSPACLVADKNEMGRHLEKILKASGQAVNAANPVLEINVQHPIVARLNEEQDEDRFNEWSHIIFDQALLSEGGQPADPARFVNRLNRLFIDLLKS